VACRGFAFASAAFASTPSPEQVATQLRRYREASSQPAMGGRPKTFRTYSGLMSQDSTEQAFKEAEAGMKRKLGSGTKAWVKRA